jgi:DNA-binding transcriptional regulator YhcF (GntR family)
MVFRVVKGGGDPSEIMRGSFFRDANLTPVSKALLVYLFSTPDGTQVDVKQIGIEIGVSRNTVYRAFTHLHALGYCKRSQSRAGNGQFNDSEYIIHETPQALGSEVFCYRQQKKVIAKGKRDTVIRDPTSERYESAEMLDASETASKSKIEALVGEVISNPEDPRWFARQCIVRRVWEIRDYIPPETFKVMVMHLARLRGEVA